MAVEMEISEGAAGSHDILRGWEITRVAMIASGLRAASTVSLTGVTTSGSGTVTMDSTLGVLLGMSLAGTGIPSPVKVMSIATDTNIVMSLPATASGTVTLAFGSLDQMGLMQAAEGLVIAVTGDRGSVCPNVGVPTYLKSFTPQLIGDDAAWVKIAYQGYPLPQFEFETEQLPIKSMFDANGSLILVSYTYPANYWVDYRYRNRSDTQSAFINFNLPLPTVTVKWLITNGTISGLGAQTATQIMEWFKSSFDGKTNNDYFTIGGITGAARTWKVKRVSGSSRDGGRTYDAAMTFQYKFNTWDELVNFEDPNTGKPPQGLVAGVGYKMVQALPTASLPTFTFPPN